MSETGDADQICAAKDGKGDVSRVSRLLRIVHLIRENPHQSLADLTSTLGIGRSQFYKDKNDLMQVGFCFEYRAATGFQITEDRLTPLIDLSISDRIVLMFALEQLSSTGDGTLAAMAMDAGRKLAGGLPSPFKEKLLECFDSQVTGCFAGYIVQAEGCPAHKRAPPHPLYTCRNMGQVLAPDRSPPYIHTAEGPLSLCQNHG